MAGSVNKVILVGNLGKDPETRTMQSGDKVVNLTIATSERWKDKNSGERQEKTEWHRVVIWNQNLVTVAEQYLKKGAKVYIEGQLETRKWTDNTGVEKYATEVVLRPFRGELTMLDSRGGSEAGAGGGYQQQSAPASFGGGGSNNNNNGGNAGGGRQPQPVDEMEDEIPF